MTGPEHYREAERLIKGLTTDTGAVYVEDGNEQVIALAQVHATLALAAATALIDETPRSDCFSNYKAWQDVAGSEYQGPGEAR
ncbi:hypothetical protein [Streptomyces sp. SGAir0924]|uniref:hypothetical protein n=1 Tax=Streptomyces sp. SGAir0924 TaxID=2109593 RepID=UPI0010CCF3F1|nr:hypothetical protein [Streptomyces sp. SGAir0924]QCR49856.1 hypothetical protein C1N79_26385 [Streptomyces sp. SGAir0924]